MEYRDAPVLSFRPIDAKEPKTKNVRRLVRVHALICVAAVALVLMLALLFFAIRPVRVKSEAMAPNYPARCVVFVTPEWGDPERGEVVAFTSPANGSGEIYVRRVVAVAGDSVEVRGGVLYVNGISPEEPYLSASGGVCPDVEPTNVPEGCVFVLGDNRTVSDDTGLVDLRTTVGVVRFALGR
ncbi:MAG: signal peptidase I [Clostridia bacterium]|nr:signal peptidase I [Clostridia bacterium]